jgi:hypothetical protein
MARNTKTKTDTNPSIELKTKVLSPKKQTELDHIQGKHKVPSEQFAVSSQLNPECGFCARRWARFNKRHSK